MIKGKLMTVLCVFTGSLVLILAPRQFSSAESSDREQITVPVITVWERFSVAKNQQMSKHPWLIQPVSCSSNNLNLEPSGRLIKGFHTVYVRGFWSRARESFLSMSANKYDYSLTHSLRLPFFPSRLCSLSPSPHHLSVSPLWGGETTTSITAWFV